MDRTGVCPSHASDHRQTPGLARRNPGHGFDWTGLHFTEIYWCASRRRTDQPSRAANLLSGASPTPLFRKTPITVGSSKRSQEGQLATCGEICRRQRRESTTFTARPDRTAPSLTVCARCLRRPYEPGFTPRWPCRGSAARSVTQRPKDFTFTSCPTAAKQPVGTSCRRCGGTSVGKRALCRPCFCGTGESPRFAVAAHP